jgi:hypothetical protein
MNWIFVLLLHFLLCVARRCYECDCEIAAQCRKKLHECVEFIKRQEDTHARSKTSEWNFHLSSVMTPFCRSVSSQDYGVEHGTIIFGVQMNVWFWFCGTKVLLPIMYIFVCIAAALNPFWSYVEPRPTVWFSCSAPMSDGVWHGFCCVCSPAVGACPTLFLM